MENMTAKQVYDACKKHDYVLFRLSSTGYTFGFNCKGVEMSKRKKFIEENETKIISYIPCSFMEYISQKTGFI